MLQAYAKLPSQSEADEEELGPPVHRGDPVANFRGEPGVLLQPLRPNSPDADGMILVRMYGRVREYYARGFGLIVREVVNP